MNNCENVNLLSADIIINELRKCGVSQFFVSPGSRSTPLTLAIAKLAEANQIDVMICPDERAAAFACLGYSQTGKLGALVCTSGTAVANYFPAIIEAHNSKIPMIVLTADRPSELKDTQSNQTIDQNQIFGKYVNFYAELDCSDRYIKLEYLLTTIDNAVFKAKSINPATVHLNCCFREPFFGDLALQRPISEYLQNRLDSDKAFTQYTNSVQTPQPFDQALIKTISNARKILFVIGKLDSFSDCSAIINLAEKFNIPIFADSLSQAKVLQVPNIINHYDSFIGNDNLSIQPELIIHFGGRIISKRLQTFIEKSVLSNHTKYIVINAYSHRQDQAHIVHSRIVSNISAFATALEQIKIEADTEYLYKLLQVSKLANSIIRQYINSDEYISEIALPNLLLDAIPNESNLFIGNSMSIRDFDSYSFRTCSSPDFNLHIAANRGASGIDGIIASAVGFGIGHKGLTTVLLGDLSALHDLNSLFLVANSTQKLIIIIVNNNGGGIFHFLPVRTQNNFEKYFATPLNINFKSAAELFRLNYSITTAKSTFTEAYHKALTSDTSTIIEVLSNRDSNHKLHQELIKSINNAIETQCSK